MVRLNIAFAECHEMILDVGPLKLRQFVSVDLEAAVCWVRTNVERFQLLDSSGDRPIVISVVIL